MLNSAQNHFTFQLADEKWRAGNSRSGETKFSSTIQLGKSSKNCNFLILGISEDIGPQMNAGLPGANSGFSNFVAALQNIQSNTFLTGSDLGILGEITQNESFKSVLNNQGWVEELDEFVVEILRNFTKKNQTIILIGGGHNNAYPLLRHVKEAHLKTVHAINIDPHADCRTTDFRHSGNPFSFAIQNGYLDHYTLIGLHESYNNQFILDFIKEQNIKVNYFENFLDNPFDFWLDIDLIGNSFLKDCIYGLDLDLDSIAFSPSSALTPSGFSLEECRKIIRKLSSSILFKYFHLPEGSPKTARELRNYAKMLSYFVADFMKCQNNLRK